MPTCQECKNFFPIEENPERGDCVQRGVDPRLHHRERAAPEPGVRAPAGEPPVVRRDRRLQTLHRAPAPGGASMVSVCVIARLDMIGQLLDLRQAPRRVPVSWYRVGRSDPELELPKGAPAPARYTTSSMTGSLPAAGLGEHPATAQRRPLQADSRPSRRVRR